MDGKQPRQFYERGRALFAAMMVLTLSVPACSSRTGTDSVSGKVIFQGRPVSGEIIFVSSDNKEIIAFLGPEGNYQIPSAPKGEYKILVKGKAALPGGGTGRPAPGGSEESGDRRSRAAGALRQTQRTEARDSRRPTSPGF